MKKLKLILTLSFVFIIGILFSQKTVVNVYDSDADEDSGIKFRFGVLAGTSYYIIDKNDIAQVSADDGQKFTLNISSADLGIHFGIMTRLQISNLMLQPEFIFNSNTINYKVVDIANSSAAKLAKENYQNLDIPLMLGYKSGFIRFMAGPVGHIFIHSKSDLAKIENFTRTFNAMTIGYQAGIGLDIGNFLIDLRYEGNLTKIGKGIRFSDKEFYFSKTPGRIIGTLTFVIK